MKKRFIIQIALFVINIFCLIFIIYNLQKIMIEDTGYSRNSKKVFLDQVSEINIEEIASKIDEFYLLKEVDFGDKYLTKDEINLLEEKYPNIKFNASIVVDAYGKKVGNNIFYLDLSKSNIDETLEELLTNFPNLKIVNLFGQDMPLERQIALVQKYPNIRFDFTIKIEDKTIKSTTKELDLSYTKLSKQEIKDLLLLFPKLKKLDLSYSNLTNEECNSFREEYPDIETNWVVHMGRWSLRTDAVAFSVLIKYFDYERMTSQDIEVLKYCTKLKALDLGHQAITDISVIGNYLPDLRILILADNKITDITPIGKLKKLHYLELFINPISNLSPLQNNKELVDLNLANLNKVTDISPILNLPMIERLWVNNMGIGWSGIETLRNAYPHATMMTTGRESTHGSWRSHPRYFQMIDMFNNNYYGKEFSKYD